VRLNARRSLGAALATFVLLAGCGGDDDGDSGDDASSAPTTTSAAATTTTKADASTTTTPPSTFRTSTFAAPFTADLPGGWTGVERGEEVAQLWVACETCEHDGEENGEISLDLTLAAKPVDEVARAMAAAPRLKSVSSIEPFSAGTLRGVHFTGTRPGGFGEVRFEEIGYHTEAEAEPIEVIVVKAAGKSVVVIVDPHKSKGDDALDFRSSAADVLAHLTFT
jgi:hypothetical protein